MSPVRAAKPAAGASANDRRLDRLRAGVFMISVAAELAHMHPQTLRIYEARGLIHPKRSPKNTRLYSQRDVERLRRIQQLTAEGLNLAGVETVLELEAQARAEARKRKGAMQPDRFTVKSQEAVAAALRLASERRNPEVAARAPAARAARTGRRPGRADPAEARRRCRLDRRTRAGARSTSCRPLSGDGARGPPLRGPESTSCSGPSGRCRRSATSTSPPTTSCWR